MKKQEKNNHQKRIEELYDREVRIAAYRLAYNKEIPSLSISYCSVDRKFQTLKIYLLSENNLDEDKILKYFDEKCSVLIARMLAETKKFRRIPRIVFLFDKYLGEINKLEEVAKKI